MRPEGGRPEHPVDVSIVVPLRVEAANVDLLLDELLPALERAGVGFEVVLVDDGSQDATYARLAARHHPPRERQLLGHVRPDEATER